MKIKVTHIELNSADIYNNQSYPNNGLFLVFDEVLGGESGGQLILNTNGIILFLCNGNEVVIEEDEKVEIEPSNDISQELFLKTLSLVVNKEESYKNQ